MINYLKQDITLLTGPAIIMHGVNCQKAMGSGVAKALYTKWPEVRAKYMSLDKEDMRLGMYQAISPPRERIRLDPIIVNCFTQEYYGTDKKQYANADAIRTCLDKVCYRLAIPLRITNIYLPKIGCGLGGLDWEKDVKPILEEVAAYYKELTFNVCDI